MGGLPIKFCDGCSQVLVREEMTEIERWVRCDSDGHAYQMAASCDIACDILDGNREGDEVAQELEACSRLFSHYACHDRAEWLIKVATFARGDWSVFDGQALD